MPHGGEHANAEHIELEQTERCDVVLVELTDRISVRAPLHRHAVEQCVVTEQDPARVHRKMTRHPVDTRDEVEQGAEPPRVEPAACELGQSLDRPRDVAAAQPRESARDMVDLLWREPQHLAHFADSRARLEGLEHADRRDTVFAVAGDDEVIDLLATMRLDIKVDVGQLVAVRVHETLEREPVGDRIDVTDTEREAHERACRRASAGNQDPGGLYIDDDVRDGEEQVMQARLVDGREFTVESRQRRLARLAEPTHEPCMASSDERSRRLLRTATGEPRCSDLTECQRCRTALSEVRRTFEQLGSLTEASCHRRGVGEPCGGGGAAEVTIGEWDPKAHAAQHVSDDDVIGLLVTDVVHGDGAHAAALSEREGACDACVVAGLTGVRATMSSVPTRSDPVVTHTEHRVLAAEPPPPASELCRCRI